VVELPVIGQTLPWGRFSRRGPAIERGFSFFHDDIVVQQNITGKLMNDELVEQLNKRIGVYDRQQILLWQQMSAVERLEVAFQAYQFALETVRLTERRRHPDLSEEEFKWRIIRRMQGNQHLGRERNAKPGFATGTE
jgi:hypothetical protein